MRRGPTTNKVRHSGDTADRMALALGWRDQDCAHEGETEWLTRSWNGVRLILLETHLKGCQKLIREGPEHWVSVMLSCSVPDVKTTQRGVLVSSVAPWATLVISAHQRCTAELRGNGRYVVASLSVPPAALTEAIPEGLHVASLAPKPYDYDPYLVSGLRKLVELAFDEDAFSDLFAQSICSALCLHLARSYGNQRMHTARRSQRALPSLVASRLADYVDSRLDVRIELDELLSVSGYSRSNFLTMFANTFDATPAQYIIKRRLARARRLLATTDQEIAFVAAESGFFDASHLIRHFKREYQITPRAYRQQLQASSKKYTFHSAPP